MIPSVLYKYLDTEEHCESFLSGTIHFTNLSHFILTEDETRKDVSEGYVNITKKDLEIATSFTFLEKKCDKETRSITSDEMTKRIPNKPWFYYVHCFSTSPDNFERFNCQYRITINNPKILFDGVNSWLTQQSGASNALGCGKINYYKRDELKSIGVANWADPLFKPNTYQLEEEFRFYFTNLKYMNFDINTKNGDIVDLLIYRYKVNIGSIRSICTVDTFPKGAPHV